MSRDLLLELIQIEIHIKSISNSLVNYLSVSLLLYIISIACFHNYHNMHSFKTSEIKVNLVNIDIIRHNIGANFANFYRKTNNQKHVYMF